MLNPVLMEEVKDELRVHYYPCVGRQFLDKKEFGFNDYVTIVRQLLRLKKMKITRREGCERVDKATYRYYSKYQLERTPVPEPIVVEFS